MDEIEKDVDRDRDAFPPGDQNGQDQSSAGSKPDLVVSALDPNRSEHRDLDRSGCRLFHARSVVLAS